MTEIGEAVAPFTTVGTAGRYRCAGPCRHEYYADIVGHKIPSMPAGCAGDRWVLEARLEPGVLDDHKREFLAAHATCVLATVRRSGGPQLTQVGYVFDGETIAICVERHLAKWRNAARNPAVAVWVGDGHRQLVVYGEAELLGDGPERDDALRAYFSAIGARSGIEQSLIEGWLREDRGIIRIRPERALASD